MRQYAGVVSLAFVLWSLAYYDVSGAKSDAIAIKSVSVESLGPNKAARASVMVRTTRNMPVYVYWSDVTTWFPAEGHPNYTISEKAWEDGNYVLLQSTIEIKKVLLEQLSYYYDYDKEHLIYYLPMTADIRSGDGQFIYHQAFDIPEKQASQNYSQARFRIIEKPNELMSYSDGDEVELHWQFLSRDENEFTLWRTVMHGPTSTHDLNYTDEILYAEDFANTYPDKIKKFDHVNVTKNVHFIGRLYLVTFTVKIKPTTEQDAGLYVLFLKSRKALSWEKALNLRISSRLLHGNTTSLLDGKVALALSFCDGSDVRVSEGEAYFGLKPGLENCMKCEAYGNTARELVLTKDRYLVHPSITNAVVHSRYYPETKSVSYTFRKESEKDLGQYYCRAVLKNNDVVSRGFQVAWTKDLTLEAKIIYVNQTKALLECKTSAKPKPELSIWRCVGDVYCSLKNVQTGPNYNVLMTEDPSTGTLSATVSIQMSAPELKKEAIMCRATNKFELQEDWLLFDDRITIEEAQPDEMENIIDDDQHKTKDGEKRSTEEKKKRDGKEAIEAKSAKVEVAENEHYMQARASENPDDRQVVADDNAHLSVNDPGKSSTNDFETGTIPDNEIDASSGDGGSETMII